MGSTSAPSSFRAWLYLVGLSIRRQARMRQMVWIAVGLLGLVLASILARRFVPNRPFIPNRPQMLSPAVTAARDLDPWGQFSWRCPSSRPNLWGYFGRAEHPWRSGPDPAGSGGIRADGRGFIRGSVTNLSVSNVCPVGTVFPVSQLSPTALESQLCHRGSRRRTGGSVAGLVAHPATAAVVDLSRQVHRCATLGNRAQSGRLCVDLPGGG